MSNASSDTDLQTMTHGADCVPSLYSDEPSTAADEGAHAPANVSHRTLMLPAHLRVNSSQKSAPEVSKYARQSRDSGDAVS